MTELVIETKVWNGLVEVARQRRQKPERLAAQVLRDFLQHQADEDLLARSEQAARRTTFRLAESEEVVRKHRARKK